VLKDSQEAGRRMLPATANVYKNWGGRGKRSMTDAAYPHSTIASVDMPIAKKIFETFFVFLEKTNNARPMQYIPTAMGR
jgi:hypothetical protein